MISTYVYWIVLFLTLQPDAFCINQMPCPSARTKYFCLGQKQICPCQNHFCPRQKILSEVEKSWPVLLPRQNNFSLIFKSILLDKSHFQGLFKSKNGLFSHGQNILSWTKHFCPGQFRFCLRQKLFCPCRRTRQKFTILSMELTAYFLGFLCRFVKIVTCVHFSRNESFALSFCTDKIIFV